MGQHFLSNLSAARRIVDSFAPAAGEVVIEIGPGTGALTDLLLDARARVTAVELDPRLVAALGHRHGDRKELTLVQGDILECDIASLARGRQVRVIANLPYSITGPVLMKLFAASGTIRSMTLMLQREVADRLVARPGGRAYGSLSVVAQYFTQPRVLLRLRPGSFSPPPAVASSVVVMPFRSGRELSLAEEERLPAFVRLLFSKRRRTLLNNLRAAGLAAPSDRLAAAGIEPARRPETLTREEVLRLFREVSFAPG